MAENKVKSPQEGTDGAGPEVERAAPRETTQVILEDGVEKPRAWTSEDGARGKDMVMSVLSSALDLAKAAVSRDEQQAAPEKVLPYYEKAIQAIDTALKLLPPEVIEKTGLKVHRESYKSRVDQLKLAVNRGSYAKHPQEKRSKQQSRVPFEQLELDPNHAMEPPPKCSSCRPYWLMRLIRQTILQGGYITGRLFVPKGVWAQVGVKFSGFAPKISAMESLLYMTIDKIITLPKPANASQRHEYLFILRTFRENAHKVQNDLARPLPFIQEIDTLRYAKATNSKSNLSRFNSMVKNLGRNVKNTAAVAYERIGASVPGKVMDDELVYYSQLVSEVCGKCQVFDDWWFHLEAAKDMDDADGVAELQEELDVVATFMSKVILNIILRDVENLLDRYLRKMRKSFARMYWDDDVMERTEI
ncbi:unnamed protein product [Chrysoparadoxa australica]